MSGAVAPGPAPLGLESAIDVSKIVLHGIQDAMLQYFAKYGPVCRFANPVDLNGAAGWLMINGPEDVRHVNASNVANYTDRYLPDIYKWVTNEKGILGSQGDYNKRHRRLCQPTFRKPALLEAFSEVVARRSLQISETIASHGSLVDIDVATQMQRLTLDIVGEVAFSYDFKQAQRIESELQGATAAQQEQANDALLHAVNEFGEVMSQVFVTPMPLLRLMNAMGMPQLKTLEGSLEVIRSTMLEVVAERRQDMAKDPGLQMNDLLGQLMTATDDEGRGATDEELWHDVHDIMGAGHETTATTAAATIYCIGAHPEVEQRVAAELKALPDGKLPCYSDLQEKLPYLTQVVKEVLRLYPPIPLFPRLAAADDVLPSGYAVQAGDVVFMSSYTLGRDPRIWADPLTFNPDRFSPEEEQARHPCAWLPFGAGPRMCLGAGFAQMSVTLMAAAMLQHCTFTPIRPTSQLLPIDYDITLNFNRTKGLKMRVEARH